MAVMNVRLGLDEKSKQQFERIQKEVTNAECALSNLKLAIYKLAIELNFISINFESKKDEETNG